MKGDDEYGRPQNHSSSPFIRWTLLFVSYKYDFAQRHRLIADPYWLPR